jgi:hypothetical protein
LRVARELLGARGIPVPPVPDDLVAGLTYFGDLVWSTIAGGHGAAEARSVFFDAAVEESEDYVHFGRGGYGAANQVFTYQLVHGPVLVAVDVPWGNLYGDGGAEDAAVAGAVADIDALVAAAGTLSGGERLVAVAPASESGSWAIVKAEHWQDAVGAAAWKDDADHPLRAARRALDRRPNRSGTAG